MKTRREVLRSIPPLMASTLLPISAAAMSAASDQLSVERFRNGDCEGDLLGAARSKGLLFGAAIQADDHISTAGPDGRGTLADFIRENVALYVPGIAFLPEHIQPEEDVFTLELANEFVARAKADQKAFRIHCMLYPNHEPDWVKTAITPSNWRQKLDRHFEAIASVFGADEAVNIDVVNELISANYPDTNGYKPNPWFLASGTEYVSYAFKKAKKCFPNVPLYWCHDQTEQLTDSFHVNLTKHILSAIENALRAGAPISGYNMQGHLELRLGFDAARLKSFLTDLTQNLGLDVIIGELDCRTGYVFGEQIDTPMPSDYSIADYDNASADLISQFLDVALPFVKHGGGKQIITWGLCDIDNSWKEDRKKGTPQGERPLPYDINYKCKPMKCAIIRSLNKS
jgi:GH35 family endo-1,4-beta-xylanase